MQSLVGPLIQAGSAFSVSPEKLTVPEETDVLFTGQAGGADSVSWTLLRDGRETRLAAGLFHLRFEAGRVTGDTTVTLRFKAVYPAGVKTKDIPVTIQEAIPDPAFTLSAPPHWDGRTPIEVAALASKETAPSANPAVHLTYEWKIEGPAVTKQITPGRLLLKRAQNSGKLTVSATASNGGTPVTRTAVIEIAEPKADAWVARTPGDEEQPEENEFYARNDRNEGTLYYNGELKDAADSVFLKVYAGDQLYKTDTVKPGADHTYRFAVKLKPGLIKYRVEFGKHLGREDTVLRSVGNLVCGDAYLINGQSNAEATAFGKEDYLFTSEWIRSFGSPDGSPQGARTRLWGNAGARTKGGMFQIGYWGMELARRLMEEEKMPICILNGAVGGTRIDQHQRNPSDPEDVATIYGRLLWRLEQARLSDGIRGVLWHQGENDQGADGPTGGFGWESYRQYFLDLAAAWKEDFPNIQHYYVFQIWPKSCSMGINGSDNRLREVQRNLPLAFSNMSIMSTLGIEPPGGCHYPPAGYSEMARLIWPVLERDNYGKHFAAAVTPPNLQRATTSSDGRSIRLEFDQPVRWDNALAGQFYLDGERGKVVSGAATGNFLTLQLIAPSTAQKISYLDSSSWSQATLLRGENGIAALTFYEVRLLGPALNASRSP